MCNTCKKNFKSDIQAWKCEDLTVWIYKTLPKKTRKARLEDFFANPLSPNHGLRFLAQSHDQTHYQAYIFGPSFPDWIIKALLREERLYVHEETN